MTTDLILQTHNLSKEFKGFVAVDRVNLNVRRGTIHAWSCYAKWTLKATRTR